MKAREFVGKVLFRTIGKWPVFPGRQIRAACGKLILCHCGKHVNIHSSAHFSSGLSLGDYSGIGVNAFLQGSVSIGADVMMGPDVKIYSINHQTRDIGKPMRLQGTTPVRPVSIEDDVWIGANVIILPGVHVGRGAILGAGSVIREDVPPYAVVVGNPSFVARYRKDGGQISAADGSEDSIEFTLRVNSQGVPPLSR